MIGHSGLPERGIKHHNILSLGHKNALYGIIVEAHLEKGDLEGAIVEFEEINKTTGNCPNRRELLCTLVKEQDTVNLQRVIDVVTEKYGEVSALYQLMETFLVMGQFQQVRKLMDTPGLRYQQDTVDIMCRHLVSQGKLEALEKFIALSKNIFGCNREYLYRQFLEAHKDDAEKVPYFIQVAQTSTFDSFLSASRVS